MAAGIALARLPSPARLAASEPPSAGERRLLHTIQRLQDLGNRSTWGMQWQAAGWLVEQLAQGSLPARIETYRHRGDEWPNVLASLPGNDPAAPPVILIAHLDSISADSSEHAPGADDNGSGVAVLLEVARRLRGTPLRRPVQFALFSSEETGRAGSAAFAGRLRRLGRPIGAVVNLDTLGYSARNALRLRGSLAAGPRRLARTARDYLAGFQGSRLLVAGRPPNAGLVQRVAGAVARATALRVDTLIRDDCG
jgi:Zn-dependent M28 family amino/carboxypeptidase